MFATSEYEAGQAGFVFVFGVLTHLGSRDSRRGVSWYGVRDEKGRVRERRRWVRAVWRGRGVFCSGASLCCIVSLDLDILRLGVVVQVSLDPFKTSCQKSS